MEPPDDFENGRTGPAFAGRLVCRPFTLACEMRLTKADGTVLEGGATLAHPGEDPNPLTHNGSPSGMQCLIVILQEQYGFNTILYVFFILIGFW